MLRQLSGRLMQPTVNRLASGMSHGTLRLTAPDGTETVVRGKDHVCDADMRILDYAAYSRIATGGSLGLAESYLAGEWDSDDLTSLLVLLDSNTKDMSTRDAYGAPWKRYLAKMLHELRPNSKTGSRRNIAEHYDLGNAFYGLWLDPSMTYSSALFANDEENLNEAQQRKYASLADRIGVVPDSHVLEVGCGWGGFIEYAAGERQARVTAVTISQEQHDFTAERIHKSGLNERVDLRLQDYRDLGDRFDAIASIEMFEAVGEKFWPVYFNKIRETLKPEGRAGLQIITIADQFFDQYRKGADFIQRYVFPGGMLPSVTALQSQYDQAGLIEQQRESFGLSYARTLDEWHQRFNAAWPEISAMGFDERFRRLWRYYLAYCEAGFRTRTLDVIHTVLQPR